MGIDQQRLPPTPSTRNAEDKKWRVAPAVDIYRPPAARRLSAQQALASNHEPEKSKSKMRRPDIQVYVPRPKRLSGVGNGVDPTTSPTAMTTNSKPPPGLFVENHGQMSTTMAESLHRSILGHTQSTSSKVLNTNDIKIEVCSKSKPTRLSLDHDDTKTSLSLQATSDTFDTNSGSSHGGNDTISKVTGPTMFIGDSLNKPPSGSNPLEHAVQCQKVEDCRANDQIASANKSNKSTNGEDLNSCHHVRNIGVNSELESHKLNDLSDLNSIDKCAIDNEPSEIAYRAEIVVPLNRKKCEDECMSHEEQNRKNRLIHHGKVISDVLVISDPEPIVDSTPPPVKTSENPPVTRKSKDKPTSVPIVETEKPTVSTSPKLSIDDCTWDMMFDENGDCLHPHLMEELTTKVGKVTIKAPRSDYKSFVTRTEFQPQDEFSHVIEIYNFSSEFKTQDLVNIFSPYKDKGFEIKWVDDTHALAVFSSPLIAADVLANDHPFVKTRPLHEATAESRTKARRSSEFLQPYRARPETCPALARRLVTGALGVRLKTAKQEREAEKALLSQAREKKRLEARQKDDAWEGILGSN